LVNFEEHVRAANEIVEKGYYRPQDRPSAQGRSFTQSVSLEDVRAFRAARYEASMALIEKKGHDYNRTQQEGGDTLFNLRVCEILGVVDTAERGILTRLTDKLMRLISLTAERGVDSKVTDESVFATIEDVHNYVDYLGIIWDKRRRAAEK
jgi:hypothetical protein